MLRVLVPRYCQLVQPVQCLAKRPGLGHLSSAVVGSDKKLFTPGPLGTAMSVKKAMLRDVGSRDAEFIETIQFIRTKLLDIAGVSPSEYTCVPVQGSGTYAVEAVFQSTVPRNGGKVLILENGAYGKRIAKICELLSIEHDVKSFPEDSMVDPNTVESVLQDTRDYTHVAIIHCETSSGVLNPVDVVGKLVTKYLNNASYFVDAMSSFGAVPIDFHQSKVDYMVSSANKCLEGLPGFSYAIARKDKLLACKGFSRSLSLDLVDQHDNLEKSKQFRFTPPTHIMLGFRKALEEFEKGGGLSGRAARYKANRSVLDEGMKKLGFKKLLDDSHKGYIITSYHFPKTRNFVFEEFYDRLNKKGLVIYPGKVLKMDCFRIGNIGQLYPDDMKLLVKSVEVVCKEMNITTPIEQ